MRDLRGAAGRAAEARAELAALEDGADPLEAAAAALAAAEKRTAKLAERLAKNRRAAAGPFATAVEAELHGVGLGEGEFRAELGEREPGATGTDEVSFLIRANPGLRLRRSGRRLRAASSRGSRLRSRPSAGARRWCSTRSTRGVGGETAHAVGETLRRLAERAQVITITHLPQIATVADRHFSVQKIPGDPTHTRIDQLDEDEQAGGGPPYARGQEFLQTVR